MPTAFSMRVSVPDHVVSRRLDDELLLLNLNSESYFGLDPVGTRMWEVLSSTETIEAAFQQLLSEYDVAEAKLRGDLDDLVDRLSGSELIEPQAA